MVVIPRNAIFKMGSVQNKETKNKKNILMLLSDKLENLSQEGREREVCGV